MPVLTTLLAPVLTLNYRDILQRLHHEGYALLVFLLLLFTISIILANTVAWFLTMITRSYIAAEIAATRLKRMIKERRS